MSDNNLNLAELAQAVAARLGCSVPEAVRAIRATLDAIAGGVVDGKRVSVTGLGSFTPVARPARTARNPQTGEPMQVPERIAVKFVPGKRLVDILNHRLDAPEDGRIVTKSPKSF